VAFELLASRSGATGSIPAGGIGEEWYDPIVPFPPAHALIGAGAAELVRGRRPWWLAWTVGAVFSLLPDVDVAVRLATGEWGPVDRSVTHSLLAVAVVAVVVAPVAGMRWSAIAAAAYGSHLAADLLQTQARTSVALLWPWQERGMEPLAHLFPRVPVERGSGMRAAALSLLEPGAIPPLLMETAIGAAVLAACAAVAFVLRRPARER
jgi:membrane-bound metal-dependent hydrolase YbcI (DUF457 family)